MSESPRPFKDVLRAVMTVLRQNDDGTEAHTQLLFLLSKVPEFAPWEMVYMPPEKLAWNLWDRMHTVLNNHAHGVSLEVQRTVASIVNNVVDYKQYLGDQAADAAGAAGAAAASAAAAPLAAAAVRTPSKKKTEKKKKKKMQKTEGPCGKCKAAMITVQAQYRMRPIKTPVCQKCVDVWYNMSLDEIAGKWQEDPKEIK